MKNYFLILFCGVFLIISCEKTSDQGGQVIMASGDLTTAITNFKLLFGGGDNGGEPGSRGMTGYREINWDGLSDAQSAPNLYPSDFFNSSSAPRSRGLILSTPGTGLMVSADKDNPTQTPPSFGNINQAYTQIFPPYSGERLFSPVGSNIAEIRFYVPGTTNKAVVKGFGAVYVDVDRVENTAFEFFDINDRSLGTYATPVLNNGHVFLGVLFSEAIVHRVKVEYGNSKLGPNEDGTIDVSVMDNFIFGEPQAVNK